MIDYKTLPTTYYEASVLRLDTETSLLGEVSADVCVIGGGLTGLSCALTLCQASRDVVLLESQVVGWGASSRSGGQVLCGYATEDLSKIARLGKISEKELFDFSLDAVAIVNSNIERWSIQCDWQNQCATAAVSNRRWRQVQAMTQKMQDDFDYPHLQLLDKHRFREMVASRRYVGGVIDSYSGHLHPLKYILGLTQAYQSIGGRLFENSRAMTINRNNGKVQVKTDCGQVSCKLVVLACNAYDQSLLPTITSRVMPVSTYMGATTPLGKARAQCLLANNIAVCDNNFVLDYFRCSSDYRLLFGGRVSYSTKSFVDLKKSLYKRMMGVFPQLSDVDFEYCWGGNVAITINRFPDIGRYQSDIYYAQGFSGHGMALTGLAGNIIAEAIIGDSERFDIFNRIEHKSFRGGKYFRMPLLVLAMLYYRLLDCL